MAHFRGVLRGNRGEVTRLGGKVMGLATEAQSWQGKCITYLWHDAKTGKDMVEVTLAQHSNGAGARPSRIVYRGPVDGSEVTSE